MTTTTVSIYDYLPTYILVISIITFIIYALDKLFAKHNMRRVPEKVLLGLSIIGGCYGGLLSMHIFHHKTKKPIFNVINVIGVLIYSYILFVKSK